MRTYIGLLKAGSLRFVQAAMGVLGCRPYTLFVQKTIMSAFFRFSKTFCILLISFAIIIALTICSRLGYNYFSGNVHTVISNQVYRTAQLDHQELLHYTKKLHLKTIINLRGAWPNNHWYEVESHFAKTHQLTYYPIQFSAYDLPDKQKVVTLVHLLEIAPKPLAFHCEGGADRTGMAAAISLILFDKQATIAQIKRQVSWHYNAISPRTVGYQLMRNYFAWLKADHYHHSTKARFLAWLQSSTPWKPYHGWFVVF